MRSPFAYFLSKLIIASQNSQGLLDIFSVAVLVVEEGVAHLPQVTGHALATDAVTHRFSKDEHLILVSEHLPEMILA